jgi:hypothetical protein
MNLFQRVGRARNRRLPWKSRKNHALEQRLREMYEVPILSSGWTSVLHGRSHDDLYLVSGGRPWPASRPVRRSRRLARPAALGLVLLLSSGAAFAASSLSGMGRPSDAVPGDLQTAGGFHLTTARVTSHEKPVVLFLGTQYPLDAASAMERWPLALALSQFGALSGVTSAIQSCNSPTGTTRCGLPTLDWSHARYDSSFVVFQHRDILDAHGNLYQRLSARQRGLYDQYSFASVRPADVVPASFLRSFALDSIFNPRGMRRLPLVMIGPYVQTLSQSLLPNDFRESHPETRSADSGAPLRSEAVRSMLISGGPDRQSSLMQHVDAEANVMTTLICRSTRGRPVAVCRRPVIEQLSRVMH